MNNRPLHIPAFWIPQAKLFYQAPWQLAAAYQLLKVASCGAHIPLGHHWGRLELKKVQRVAWLQTEGAQLLPGLVVIICGCENNGIKLIFVGQKQMYTLNFHEFKLTGFYLF